MKRDWDLIREYLLAIEGDSDLRTTVLADLSKEPIWADGQTEQSYIKALEEFRAREGLVFGHLELLVDGGYVVGLKVIRSMSGDFGYALSNPRLTNAGHDLLDSIRSPKVWTFIKDTAKSKGADLTFDLVKALYPAAIKFVFG